MPELGKAFVSIFGDITPLKTTLTALRTESWLANAGTQVGQRFTAAISAAVANPAVGVGAAAAVAIGLAGKGLFDLGEDWDRAYDKIRITTGKTGSEFEALKNNLKDVARQSGASLDDIATAISQVSVRSGATGPTLETLSRQFLILTSRVGGDLKTNIEASEQAFAKFHISVKDQPAALDDLFKVSQMTGVGVGQLAEQIKTFGAPLQVFGFSFRDSAALLGEFEHSGVNVTSAMTGLRLSLKNLKGEDAQKFLEENTKRIKDAHTESEAAGIAIKIFGARAGPEMAAAIRSGKFDFEDLVTRMKNSRETILGAAADTKSFSQSWSALKNQLRVALEPAATAVFTGISDAMKKIGEYAGPVLKFMEPFTKLLGGFAGKAIAAGFVALAVGIGVAAVAMGSLLIPLGAIVTGFQKLVGWLSKVDFGKVGAAIADFFEKLPGRVANFFEELPGRLADFFEKLPGRIAGFVADAGRWLLDTGPKIIGGLINGLTTAVKAVWDFFVNIHLKILGFLVDAGSWLLDVGAKILHGLWTGITIAAGAVWDFFKSLGSKAIGLIGDAGSWLLNAGKDAITGLWHGIETSAAAVWDFFKNLPHRILFAIGYAGGWLLRTGSQAVEGLGNGITQSASGIWNFFKGLPDRIRGFLGDAGRWLLQTGVKAAGGLVNGLASAAGAIWDFFKRLPGRIGGFIADAGHWLLDTGKKIVRGIIDGLEAAVAPLWDFFKRLPGRIRGFLGDAGHWLLDTGHKIVQGIIDGLGAAASGIWDFFKRLPGRIRGFIGDVGHWLLDTGKKMVQGIVDGLGSAAGGVWDFFKKLPGRITGAIGAAAKWLFNTGKDIISGLLNGIWDAIKAVGTWIYDHVFKPIIKGFLSAFGIGSPAKAMLSIGRDIIGGILEGIWSVIKTVGTWLWDHVGKPIVGAFKEAWRWLIGAGKSIIGDWGKRTGLIGGFHQTIDAWGSIFTHIKDWIVNGFKEAWRWLVNAGKAVLGDWDKKTGLIGGIHAQINAWGSIFTHIKNWVVDGFKDAWRWVQQKGKDIIGSWDRKTGLIGGMHQEMDAFGSIFTHIKNWIVGGFTTAGGWLFNAGKSVLRGLFNGISAIGSVVGAVGKWFWDHVGWPFISGLGNLASTLGGWLVEAGKWVIRGLFNGIKNIGGAIGAAGRWFWDNVGWPFISGLGNLPSTLGGWLVEAGKWVLRGLFNGIKGAIGEAGSIIGDVKDGVVNWFKNKFGIGSPAKVMIPLGQSIADGLRTGISNGTAGVLTAIGGLKTGVISSINGIPTAAKDAARIMGNAFGDMGGKTTTLASTTATQTGRIVSSHSNMATGVGAAGGRVVGSLNAQDVKTKLTQANHDLRMAQIRAQADRMQASVAGAVGRYMGDLGRQDGKTNQTQANHNTRMGQIRGQADAMQRGIGTTVGRFIGDLTRQDNKTNQTQTNHNTRMGQIRGQADAMERGIGATVGRFIGDLTRQDNKTNQTQVNHNTRMGQIRGQADAMQRGIGATVGRFIGNMLSQDNQTNRTQANHGTRMGQINTASTRMADNTGTQTGRVNRSYQGMQRQVDSLHGKNINVSSRANVNLPPDSQLQAALNHAAQVIGAAVALADGGIVHRAGGGIDRLPDQAVISPVKGSGLINWAEAETGGEAFIPLAASKRSRSLAIWKETGRLLGAFASGGLLNILTALDQDDWNNRTTHVQTVTDDAATRMGRAAADKLAEAISKTLTNDALTALVSRLAPHGPGYSISGSWAAGIRPWVDYIARSLNISAMTYSGHHPAQSHAADLALGQAGMVNTAPATGPSGNDLYSAVARWIDSNILAKNTPGWYVGTHAAIHSRGGAWHPASSQVGRRGQTFAHDDHVHVSFDPRYDGAPFGIPGNYSAPGFSWNEGAGPPSVPATVLAQAGSMLTAAFGSTGRWTQAQMEAAIRAAGLDAGTAHIFGAIGMGETGGWNFPTTNPTGRYHGPWAFQEAWAIPAGIDVNRLDRDLMYAAQQVVALYRRAGWQPWYGDSPQTGGNFQKFLGEGGILDRLGHMLMADGGIMDSLLRRKRKTRLDSGDEDWGADQSAIRGVRGRTFDQGGWLEPGITIAHNKTGKPERVVAPQQEFAAGGIRANPFIIGDSISWLSRKELLSKIPGANFAVFPGVQWPWGVNQLHANPPHGTVVYLLGTNFGASATQMSSLLSSNPLSKFVLMTLSIPKKWEAATNAAVRATKNRNPWRVAIADWHAAVAAHPNYLGPDRVHPNTAAGRSAFANVAAGAVNTLSRVAAAMQSLEFSRILKLRTLAAPYLDHKPASYNTWSGNQQFAYWARFPAVVALLKAIHQKEIEGWFKKVSGHNYLYGRRFPDFAAGDIRLPAGSVRSQAFDEGGYLRPGVTVAENRTGRAERVVAPATDEKTVALLTQLVAIMGEQNRLLRTMPGAQADALNSVAYRAMSYR